MTELKVGCSPITRTIYVGKTRINKDGQEIWTSNRQEVTEQAVDAVVNRLKGMPGMMEKYKWEINGKEYVLKLVEYKEETQ